MKKLIATLAIAGIGATLAVGAQAQTIGSNPAGSFLVNVAETTALQSAGMYTGDYKYTYTFTLTSDSSGVPVNSLAFGFSPSLNPAYIGGSETATGAFALAGVSEGTSALTFTALSGGLTLATPSTVVTYYSPYPAVTSGVQITPGAAGVPGAGNTFPGPGIAVPEAGSLGLLGLGMLPLAFLARRRMVRAN